MSNRRQFSHLPGRNTRLTFRWPSRARLEPSQEVKHRDLYTESRDITPLADRDGDRQRDGKCDDVVQMQAPTENALCQAARPNLV